MKDNYLRQIFIKCVAAIIGSQGIRIDKATFEYIVLLAELRMQDMYSDLAQIIKVQRHTQPSIDDIVLWLTRNNIDLLQKQQISGKHVDLLNSLQFDFDVEDITKEQEVFFNPQLFQIKKIVPSTEKVPSYAPEWSPALPPDHTYMATADYPNRVRGLQELHEKLFEEGHMAELALQRLLGSKGSDSAISLKFPGNKPANKPAAVVETTKVVETTEQAEQAEPVELPQTETAPSHSAEDVDMVDAGAVHIKAEGSDSSGNPEHNSAAIETENPGVLADDAAAAADEQAKEQKPKPYITIVNSEPAPESPANDKPLSLKINLRKPKKQKVSQRPKVDIVEMARNQALEQQQNLDAAAEAGEETSLQALLEKAMASVDA